MVSGYGAPGGQRPQVLMTPVAAAQAAGVLRQALEQGGWQVVIAPDAASYVRVARACVVIVSPETTTDPEVTAAIGAGYTTLIPVMTAPTPVPYAQWSIAPVLLGSDAAQQQMAAATILQSLGQIAPAGPQTAPTPAPYMAQPAMAPTPYYAAPPSTPYYAPPSTPMYAPPSTPMYAQPAQPSMPMYPQQAYPQYGAVPNIAGQKSGMPGWARALIIIAVIAALGVGGMMATGHNPFVPSVGGQWTLTFTEQGSQLNLSLTQSWMSLNGTLSNTQGDSVAMTGSLNGNNITLSGTYTLPNGGGYTEDLSFTGTVSSDANQMSGSDHLVLRSANGGSQNVSSNGGWTATRGSSGSSGVSN